MYAPGSLLTVADLRVEDVSSILAETTRLERMPQDERARVLAGRRIALLFYESSTRTRTSFELAAKSLGATTTLVSAKSSSIEKGARSGLHYPAASELGGAVLACADDEGAGVERGGWNA
jgi:aspartate carbamoyltransferase catalytic subunit